MKKIRVPDKVKIMEIDNSKQILIAPRDRTGYDLGVRLLGSLSIAFVTVGLIADTPNILFLIFFLMIFTLLVIIPVLISFITLNDRFEIRYNNENITIQKIGVFSTKKKIKIKDIEYIELKKVTPNLEPFNAYIGFRSMFQFFNDFIPSLGLKGEPSKSILQYHDKEIREWIVKYLDREFIKK